MAHLSYPAISIIIPVYNARDYIEDCIRSVISQSYTGSLECILVDDCGNDDSIDICERLITGYDGPVSFRVLHHESNRGAAAARNTGTRSANGDYICYFDSDDKITSDYLQNLAKPLIDADYDIVIGDYTTIEGDDVFMHLSMPEGTCLGRNQIATAKRKNQWYPMVWGKLYRRAFLQENGLEFYEGIIFEDELFSVETACMAESMFCLPQLKSYLYRVRPGSVMTATQYDRRRESCERMLEQMYAFMQHHSLNKDQYANDLLYFLFSFANECSWRFSKKEYNRQYGKYRTIVSRDFSERLLPDKRLKAFVRDLHFVLPMPLGRFVFRTITFNNRRIEND